MAGYHAMWERVCVVGEGDPLTTVRQPGWCWGGRLDSHTNRSRETLLPSGGRLWETGVSHGVLLTRSPVHTGSCPHVFVFTNTQPVATAQPTDGLEKRKEKVSLDYQCKIFKSKRILFVVPSWRMYDGCREQHRLGWVTLSQHFSPS